MSQKLGLKAKLIGGFLVVALILLIVGITGYWGISTLKNFLHDTGEVKLPSIEALLIISESQTAVNSAENALLSTLMDNTLRKAAYDRFDQAKKQADDAWKIYEPLLKTPDEAEIWKQLVPAWEAWWTDHEVYTKLSYEFEALGIPDPAGLQRDLYNVRGIFWKTIASLTKQIKDGIKLAETDTINTFLVKGSEDWVTKIKTSNTLTNKALQDIQPINAVIMETLQKIQDGNAKGDRLTTLATLEKEFIPNAMKVIEMMRPIRAEVDKATKLYKQMSERALVTNGESLRKAENFLNQLVEINKKAARDSVVNSETTAYFALTLDMIMIIAGFVLALTFGLVLSLSITRPLKIGVAAAQRVADGDLTTRIDIRRDDEIGQLSAALNKMTENLSQVISGIQQASEQVASSAEELSATSQSVANSATEQASCLDKTSTAVLQLTSSIEESLVSAVETDGVSSRAAMEADKGGKAVMETVEAMRQIADRIMIINDIADQTNLLALNAAIEAARAGEMGKGFAVVAVEVRKLAERSQFAAKEISELARESVSKAEKAGQMIVDIVPGIKNASQLVQQIALYCKEQTVSADVIKNTIHQLDLVVQQNSSTSEESSSASEELSAQAVMLQEMIAKFKISEKSMENKSRIPVNSKKYGTTHSTSKPKKMVTWDQYEFPDISS